MTYQKVQTVVGWKIPSKVRVMVQKMEHATEQQKAPRLVTVMVQWMEQQMMYRTKIVGSKLGQDDDADNATVDRTGEGSKVGGSDSTADRASVGVADG